MSNDKISLIRLNKRNWFGKDRKTKFRFAEPTHNYFMSKIKEVTEDFLTENKNYLLEHNPALLYTMRNKPVPKKYQGKVAADIPAATPQPVAKAEPEVTKEVAVEQTGPLSPLDQYQEDQKKKKQEQLDKQKKMQNQLRFSAAPKKDPNCGMGWVDPFTSINQGKLGHSQSWKFKNSKKFEYY
jgi:hypothetical protein